MKLIIDLLARTGMFETDMKRAEKSLEQFRKKAREVGKAVGVAFAAGATAAAVMVKSAINNADAMSKMAQAAGQSVEGLSALAYAADLSGISQETLGGSLTKLSKNMGDAAIGTGEAIKGFEALGISVKNADGSMKSSSSILSEVAAKFAKMEDGTNKTALAVNLFGRSGAQLIPLLNAGADGISEMTKEAAELGLVLDTETARSAERFNDTLNRISKLATGAANRVMADLLPSLNSLAEGLFEGAKGAGALDKAADIATTAVRLLVSGGVILGGIFKTIGEALGGLAATLVEFFAGNWKRAWSLAKDTTFDFAGNVTGTIKTVGAVWDTEASKIAASAQDKGEKIAAPMLAGAQRTKRAVDSIARDAARATAEIGRMLERIKRDVQTFGMEGAQVQLFDLQAAGASPQQIEQARAYLDELARLQKAQAELDATTKRAAEAQREIAQVYEQTRTPAEALSRELERLNGLLAEGMDWDTYSRAVFDAQDRFDQATAAAKDSFEQMDDFAKNAAENIQRSLGDFLEDGMRGNFRNIGDSFVQMLNRMAAEAVAAQIARKLFGTESEGGKGGWIGSAISMAGKFFGFGGARAGGGDVLPNSAFLVGEQGPEMFVPRTAGTIVPTQDLATAGAGRSPVNQYNTFAFAAPTSTKTQTQVAARIAFEQRRAARLAR